MPAFHTLLNELNEQNGNTDTLRNKYLKQFAEKRGRNVVCYYANIDCSSQKIKPSDTSINVNDIDGFMAMFHNIGERTSGLDVILHTTGGDISASERIANYINSLFEDVEVFVPQMSMSGGTMIACASKKIWLGKQSCLGPVDPQIDGIPVVHIYEFFNEAKDAIAQCKPDMEFYKQCLSKYNPHIYFQVQSLLALSREIICNHIINYMKLSKEIAEKIADRLMDIKQNKIHGRPILLSDCESIGLNVGKIEENNDIQDLLLSIHHSFMLTFQCNPTLSKIFENHTGKILVRRVSQE